MAQNKLVRAVLTFDTIVTLSIRFWLIAARFGFVYGWQQAATALFTALRQPEHQSEPLRATLKRPQSIHHAGRWSITLSLTTMFTIVTVRLVAQWPHALALQLLLVVLIVGLLCLIVYETALAFICQLHDFAPHSEFLTLKFLVAQPLYTLALGLTAIGTLLCGYLNPIVALLIMPTLYFFATGQILSRVTETKALHLRHI